VPARDRVPARPGKGGGRSAPGSRASVTATPASPGTASSNEASSGKDPARGNDSRSATAPAPAPADLLVVGPVPVLARVVGLLLVLAGLVGAVAVFPTYLVVGGTAVSPVTGPVDALVALVAPVAAVAVGIGLLLGRVPRLGLGYAAVTGALAVGRLLIELYQGHGSTARPAVEVLAGERVITSSVQTGAGWVLGVVALSLTVLAGIVALVAWGRTVMEDGGSLDPLRPALAGAAVVLGVFAVLCLALPAADVPDRVVTDPTTGLETVVTEEGPQALLERPGLALLGGLLLAGALLLCAVIAPSLRPRLGAVGGLLGVTVFLLAAALTGLRDAVHSPDVEWTVPGAGLLLLALASAVLTLLAWRWRAGSGAPAGA
jgi:iron complex transport system permease protein